MSQVNNPKIIRAWTMYDWANSVYSLSISSAIFPIFFSKNVPNKIDVLGHQFESTTIYSYCLSAAFLLIVLINPILSGIADFGGYRKKFMRLFVVLGSLGCSALYFFDGDNYIYGLMCFMLASIGWAGSLVFYNAYLPEIVTKDRFDTVSARGYTMGYIGSVLMLVFNLVLILSADKDHVKFATQIGFLTVGIWWFAWSLIPLAILPSGKSSGQKLNTQVLKNGYKEIRKVFGQVRKMPDVLTFLLSFFIYTMGVQTIIYVAGIFGEKELKLSTDTLITTILLIQLIGIGGAYFFAFLANKIGNKLSIIVALTIWGVVCVLAYGTPAGDPNRFYMLAALVGIVMGGIQSLSRATYSKLIPGDVDNTSYFSFYEITEKLAMVIGLFVYGFVNELTHNMRTSILVLMTFFIVGILILLFLKSDKLLPAKRTLVK